MKHYRIRGHRGLFQLMEKSEGWAVVRPAGGNRGRERPARPGLLARVFSPREGVEIPMGQGDRVVKFKHIRRAA